MISTLDRSGWLVTGQRDASSSVPKRTSVTWSGAGNTSTWSIAWLHRRPEHGEARGVVGLGGGIVNVHRRERRGGK